MGIKQIFAVPLSVFSGILGFVIFFRKKREPFLEEEKSFLRNIAKSMAISVEIRSLILDLKKNLERERLLTEKTVRSFIRGIEVRDSYTRGHSERVAYFSKRIAEEMGLPKSEVDAVYTAALLHDVGKIGIPDSILLKPSRLTKEEYEIIKLHPILSYELLRNIDPISASLPGIKYHHERWDGSGYPEGLKGKDIPLQARILAVADSFDAMTSDRIYRKGLDKKKAIEELRSTAGKLYDPEVVENAVPVLLGEEPTFTSEIYVTSKIFKTLEERRLDYFLRDHLTGVFNRNAFEFAYAIAKERFGRVFAFSIDVKELRKINMNEGWEKGDEILKRVTEFLKAKFSDALIVRYSGDNFVVFTKNPVQVEGIAVNLGSELSVGITSHVLKNVDNLEELKRELTKLEFS